MNTVLRSCQVIVQPLALSQLRLQLSDPPALARELGYPGYVPEPSAQALADALQQMIAALEKAPQQWPWVTNWVVISLKEAAVIGGCCFHGAPDVQGQAEVGYGLDRAFQGHGYMVQALRLLVGWGFSQAGLTAITAETDLDNLPSQRVLQRSGFCPCRVTSASLWWRLDKAAFMGTTEGNSNA